jgi:predicted TIM-barrel enzyme
MARAVAQKNIFSIVYVFNGEEAKSMTDARAGCIVAHVGLAGGGMVGTTKALSIGDSAVLTKKILAAGQRQSF